MESIFSPLLDALEEAERNIALVKKQREKESQLYWVAVFIFIDSFLNEIRNRSELFEMANKHLGPIEFVEVD